MVTLGPDNSLWFGFGGNDVWHVGRLTMSGAFTQFGVHGRPWDLSWGPDGAVWLTEYGQSQIVRVGLDGSEEDFQLPSGEFPVQIVTGPDGALWFNVATGIGRLTTDGSYSRLPLSGSSNGLFFAPDGTLWVTVRFGLGESGELQRWTTGGRLLESFQLDLDPLRITAAADGTIWFTAGALTTNPTNFEGRLGEVKDGAIGVFVVPTAETANGLVVIGGSVWFSDLGGVSRYIP
jgi:virginiamycin B lyase